MLFASHVVAAPSVRSLWSVPVHMPCMSWDADTVFTSVDGMYVYTVASVDNAQGDFYVLALDAATGEVKFNATIPNVSCKKGFAMMTVGPTLLMVMTGDGTACISLRHWNPLVDSSRRCTSESCGQSTVRGSYSAMTSNLSLSIRLQALKRCTPPSAKVFRRNPLYLPLAPFSSQRCCPTC